jgi:hypothetical protein
VNERMLCTPPTRHTGKSRSRVHNVWLGMKQRCFNKNNRFYAYYGARGITIDPRWMDFTNLLADMGEPPEDREIDRIDNDGPYAPWNCRWTTRTEQQNNRRANRTITLDGKTQTISQWSRDTGIHHNTITQRLDAGLSPTQILSPELRRNMTGLALGGKASGAKRSAQTHCKNGHPFDELNSFWNGRQRVCRACKRDRERVRRLSRA